MKTEELRTMLTAQGIDAEEVCIIKNGIECHGIRLITSDEISPIVYYSPSETAEEFLNRCKQIQEMQKPIIDTEMITNPEYIKEHAFLCVQKKSNENLIKRNYLNLEVYIRVGIGLNSALETGSIKPTRNFLNDCELDEATLWEFARANTLGQIKVQSVQEMLGIIDDALPAVPLYIFSCENNYGAAALCLPELFQDFCKEHEVDGCVVLPSSTAEVLAIPDDMVPTSAEDMADMVRCINASDVEPILQLEPVVYHFDVSENAFSILADDDERR